MKKLITALFILCCSIFADPTTVHLNTNNNTTNCNSASTTSCAITVTSTGAGNVLQMVVIFGATTGDTINSVSGGCTGSWTVDSASKNTTATTYGSVFTMAYCLSSSAGATTVTATINNTGQSRGGYVLETALDTGYTAIYDTSGVQLNGGASTSQPGPTLTLSGSHDIILQICGRGGAGNPSAVTGGYTIDATSPDGLARIYNTASGTAPTYTITSATMAVGGVAITEYRTRVHSHN